MSTTASSLTDLASRASADRGRREAVKGLGRAGFAAKALLYAVIGLLAGRLALGDGAEPASSNGAFDVIAEQPFGRVLLALTAAGLVLYGLWRLAMVVRGDADRSDLPASLVRTAWATSGVFNLGLGWLAASAVLGQGQSGGEQSTGTLLGLPGGVAMVGIVGLVLVGVGIDQGRRAANGDWADHLDLSSMTARQRNVAIVAGKAGHAGRSLAFAVMGVFLLQSAFTFDPDEPVSLDAALRELQGTALGLPVLLAVAAGLVAYGVWCGSVTLWGEPHE